MCIRDSSSTTSCQGVKRARKRDSPSAESRMRCSLLFSRTTPMPQRALAAIQQRAREVIKGALAVFIFTAVALQARLVVVRPPRTDVVTLTAGTLEWALF